MTLHQEFPEYDSLITKLKKTNKHFKRIFEEYETLNHKISGIEHTGIFTDSELNEMRLKRVQLKDALRNYLID